MKMVAGETKRMHDEISRAGLALLDQADEGLNAAQFNADLYMERETPLAAFDTLIGNYADTCGPTAAEAFRMAIRLWHLGGTVIMSSPPTGIPLPDAIGQG